MISVHTALTQM